MKRKLINYIKKIFRINKVLYFLTILSVIYLSFVSFADTLIDKQGRDVYETLKHTAEVTIDPDTISAAIRHVPSSSKDYSNSDYNGPTKNIFSSNIIMPEESYDEEYNNFYKSLLSDEILNLINTYGNFTRIRHTASITNVDENRYAVSRDNKTERIKMKIIYDNIGKIDAKNGFYKVSDKTFYFDEDGLMVLGPALDDIGNYYFFSYETGELIEEVQKK